MIYPRWNLNFFCLLTTIITLVPENFLENFQEKPLGPVYPLKLQPRLINFYLKQ